MNQFDTKRSRPTQPDLNLAVEPYVAYFSGPCQLHAALDNALALFFHEEDRESETPAAHLVAA